MSRRKARLQETRGIASRMRNRKTLAIIAGVTAAIVILLVLIPGTLGTQDEDVVAMVNGKKITSEDVTLMRARHLAYDRVMDADRALEQLIVDTLLYDEASRDGYILTSEEAERELHAQLEAEDLALEDFKADLELYGISYSEFLNTFRRELAIANYLDDAIAVTEDEARERYEQYIEEYARVPDLEIPPYEDVRAQIIREIQQEKMSRLIRDLVREAEIIRYTDSG